MSKHLRTPGGATNDTWDQEKADLGFSVAQPMREHGNYTLGILLTIIDGVLGDTLQSKAVKNQIKREMYLLIDRNQAEVYEHLGVQRPGLMPKEIHLEDEEQ